MLKQPNWTCCTGRMSIGQGRGKDCLEEMHFAQEEWRRRMGTPII
jgi:hypothetical protein